MTKIANAPEARADPTKSRTASTARLRLANPSLFDVRPTNGRCCAPGTGIGGACFSSNGRFRYALWRRWDDRLPYVLFVLLNPSVADETVLDRTMARSIGFARAAGFGGILVGNISPLVSTDRRAMYRTADRSGPGRANEDHLERMSAIASRVVLAYGASADHPTMRSLRERADRVIARRTLYEPLPNLGQEHAFDREPYALRVTAMGLPEHPLYLPSGLEPAPYAAPPRRRKKTTARRTT